MAVDPMEELAVAFNAMAADMTAEADAMAVEDFNAESTHIEHDLAEYGEECNHDGALIRVNTPWAMGFVDEQGVSLV